MKKVQEKNSDPADSGLFISRELSWIDFNARVLDEAGCAANPVLERLKFIAIFSSNLDEFFMVRIAGLRQLVKMGQDLPDPGRETAPPNSSRGCGRNLTGCSSGSTTA